GRSEHDAWGERTPDPHEGRSAGRCPDHLDRPPGGIWDLMDVRGRRRDPAGPNIRSRLPDYVRLQPGADQRDHCRHHRDRADRPRRRPRLQSSGKTLVRVEGAGTMTLVISDLSRTFSSEKAETIEALSHISLSVNNEEFICILGSTGCRSPAPAPGWR